MKMHTAHETHGTVINGKLIYRPACSSGQNSHGMVAQNANEVDCKKCLAILTVKK